MADLLQRSFHRISLVIVALAMCASVRAQGTVGETSSSASFADDVLETIVVIDDIPSTGDVQHGEFTGSYQRIGPESLQRRDITVADILSYETGVQSRQSGGFGTFSQVTVRGASAAQTGVYLDGVLLNSGGNAVVDLSMLELLTIDSVDVYRGVTPMQLGGGSIGGAVNLKTSSVLEAQSSTVALVGVGSFNSQRTQLLHRSSHGQLDVVGAFSVQQSDNDYPFLDNNGSPLNPDDDVRELRNNADVRKVSTMGKTGFQWSSQARSDLLLQTTRRDLGIPEFRNAPVNQADLLSENLRMQFNHTVDGIGNWNSRYNAYLHTDDSVFDDRLGQTGLGAQNIESDTQTQGFSTYWEHIGDSRTTSFSAEFRQEAQDARDLLDDTYDYRAERQSVNVNAQSVGYFQNEKLLITTGLGLQSNNDQFDRITLPDSDSRSALVLIPSIGARYNSSEQLSFRANLGRFYREATFNELFARRGLFNGNNDLRAEEGINLDVGFSWQANKAIKIDTSIFSSWRDDLIATVHDSRGVGRTVNIDQAQIVGLEFSANWQLNSNFSLRANATVQDSSGASDFRPFDGKEIPGEAKQTAYVRLQHTHKNFRTFIETDGAWNRFYDRSNSLPAEDSLIQNVGVDWKRGRWSLNTALTNITDQNVEDFNGFPRPGRAFSLSLSVNL